MTVIWIDINGVRIALPVDGVVMQLPAPSPWPGKRLLPKGDSDGPTMHKLQ